MDNHQWPSLKLRHRQVVIAVKWKLCVDFLLNDGVDHMTAFTSKHVNGFPSRAYYFRNEMSSVQSIYNEERWASERDTTTTTMVEEKDEEEFINSTPETLSTREVYLCVFISFWWKTKTKSSTLRLAAVAVEYIRNITK